MPRDQILMGLATALLCATGLWKSTWFLHNTRKGTRLVSWCGYPRALWVWRLLMAGGIAFGLLLAGGIINPLRW